MLELRVSSPRILMCDALKLSARLFRYLIYAVVIVIFGVSLRIGYQKVFVENSDFVLQEVKIETSEGAIPMFVSRERVIQATGIDPEASIFSFDVDDVQDVLSALPEVASVDVTRRLPGTLKIELVERVPVAWLACPALGIEERNPQTGFLTDESGVAFPCDTQELANYAAGLPVVFAESLPDRAIVSGEKINHEGLSYALELALNADAILSDHDLPNWVMVRDELTLEMQTIRGTRCTLSYFDQREQLIRLDQLSRSARARGRAFATINLIPKRYVPVTYLTSN